ncbi:MAG: tRNA lysidine(34) synthetase TilS, partial [Gammaproteobacteria bacterium]|nr:tRNA lysidine(34) synthetase TilS [Gammaproteobacteria bacterium]
MSALADKLIRGDRRPLLLGLSGGLDSVVLLHALATTPDSLQGGLRAIHVDHGLHPHAGRWTIECRRLCMALQVPLTTVRVEVARHGGEGPEAAARKARHLAFEAELGDDEVLALAHHQADQAETFLMRALRSSGPDGLGAMRPWRRFGRGWLWRPLLDVPRAELIAYARQHGLQWVEDPGNADVTFDRNFLRHRVLPLLRERWPQADAALARSAGLNAEAAQLLDPEDAQLLARVRGIDPQTLDVEALAQLPMARRARVLRRWIATLGLPPLPATGVARIQSQLLAARADSHAEFAWANAVVRHWRGSLHAERQRAPLPSQYAVSWDGRSALQLPTGGVLQLLTSTLPETLAAANGARPIRQEN